MAKATFHTNPQGYAPTATVTVKRSTIDITVTFAQRGGQWFMTNILDEHGNGLVLTETERLLATSLVEAGC